MAVPTWFLLLTALALGLRHGVDWDHISAIMDIASTQKGVRRALVMGWFYAAGHGTVVGALGMAAVLVGLSLPPALDSAMAFLIGITLIVLSLYVLNMILRHPTEDIRMKSRWVLIANGAASFYRKIVVRLTGRTSKKRTIELRTYGPLSAYVIGIVHGTGGETPTQILLFLLAAGVEGASTGVAVVLAFVAGVFGTNTIESLLAAVGYSSSANRPRLFRRVAGAAAVFSFILGVIFLLGVSGFLPPLS